MCCFICPWVRPPLGAVSLVLKELLMHFRFLATWLWLDEKQRICGCPALQQQESSSVAELPCHLWRPCLLDISTSAGEMDPQDPAHYPPRPYHIPLCYRLCFHSNNSFILGFQWSESLTIWLIWVISYWHLSDLERAFPLSVWMSFIFRLDSWTVMLICFFS